MNTTEIEILLNRFYEGETTLDEEKILRDYFLSGAVNEMFKTHIPVFKFYGEEVKRKLRPELEFEMENSLPDSKILPFFKNKKNLFYISGVAASLIFIFSLIFEMSHYNNVKNVADNLTYTKAETHKAYEQTRIALAYVSGKYARGVEPLGDIEKLGISTMAVSELAKFSEEINNLNYNVNKMNTGVDNLSKLSKFTIFVKP